MNREIGSLLLCGGLVSVTILSGGVLVTSNVHAEAVCTTDSNTGVITCNDSATASVTVTSACTMSSVVDSEHEKEIVNGDYQTDIGTTTLTTYCNDAAGFSIYAIGYSGLTEGNNTLIGNQMNTNIASGTATSGTISNWAVKITATGEGDFTPTVDNSFSSYHIVPTTYTKVAHLDNQTGAGSGSGSVLTTTYAAYISGSQAAGTYNGKVKYVMVHPESESAPAIETND